MKWRENQRVKNHTIKEFFLEQIIIISNCEVENITNYTFYLY